MQPSSFVRDPLTGALSRSALQERFRQEIERAQQDAAPLSVMLMDLDHFKSVNDAFGHLRGDEVLTECVQRIQGVIRGSDAVFRYGGDEFVLLLPHTELHQARAVADRLLHDISQAPFGGTPPIRLTASVGIATYPFDGDSPERLFAAADARHYAAKRGGRNRTVAGDRLQPEAGILAEVSRVLGRDEPLDTVRQFLDQLLFHRTGVLKIFGSRGSGRSRFLTEVGRAARLRGFAVLHVRGTAALRMRAFGALVEALDGWDGVAPPSEDVDTFIRSVGRFIADKGVAGLIVAVDDLADLDALSVHALRNLLVAGGSVPLALAYTTDSGSDRPPLLLGASLQEAVRLEPLRPGMVKIWLRTALRWEPPPELADWLCHETQGLPALIELGLRELIEQQLLQRTEDGWRLSREYAHTRLRRRLDELYAPRAAALPAFATSFVGRETELRLLKGRLDSHRLVTVMGPGGIGKSRLALQAATEVQDQFRHGGYFVPLAPVESADLIVSAVASAMGVQLSGTGSPMLQILRYLKDREILLVLDNVEHLIHGMDLVAEILQTCPRVRLIATSRERLHLPGESILELGGLLGPGVLLFVERARLLDAAFALTEANTPHVQRICQAVHGIPLGIELAAAWIRMLSCEEIADSIVSSPDVLLASGSDLAERHRSLRSVFAHSQQMLSHSEQLAFAQLSVFRGGFTREAARAVAGASLFLLSGLVDKSLVYRTGTGRYAVHELIGQYAAELLDQEAWTAVEEKHARYFLGLAESLTATLSGAGQVDALQRLSAEHDNLRAALAWALRTDAAETALRIGGALWQFWWRRGHLDEGRRWLASALAADDALPGAGERTHARAVALFAAAKLALEQDGGAVALEQAEESVRLFQSTRDREGEANALAELGHALRKHGDYTRARQCFDESLSLRRQAGDTGGICTGLVGLGLLALSQGDYAAARAHLSETLALQQTSGNRLGVIQAQSILATIHMVVGEYAQAEALLEESIRLIDRADAYSLSITLALLGEVALVQAKLERARPLLLESLSLKQVANLQGQMPDTLLNLGYLARRSGDAVEARSKCQEALSRLRQGGDQRNAVNSLVLAASVAWITGREERAARLLGAAEAGRRTMGYTLNLASRHEFDYLLQAMGERLTRGALESAHRAGSHMTLEQAADYAMSDE